MPAKRKPTKKTSKPTRRVAPKKKSPAISPKFKLSKKRFPATLFAFVMLGVLVGGYLLVRSWAASSGCVTCSYLGSSPEGPQTYNGQTYDAKVEFEHFVPNFQVGFNTSGDGCYAKYQHIYDSTKPFEQQPSGGWNIWIRGYDIFDTKMPNYTQKMQAPFTAAEIPDAASYLDLTDYQKNQGNVLLYQAYQLSKYLSPYYGKNAYRLMTINQNAYIDDTDPSSITGNSPKLGQSCRVGKTNSATALVKVTNTGTAPWAVNKAAGESYDSTSGQILVNGIGGDPNNKMAPFLATTIDLTKANQLFGGIGGGQKGIGVITDNPGSGQLSGVNPGESIELTLTFYDAGKFNFGGRESTANCSHPEIYNYCGGVTQPGVYEIPIQMVIPGKTWFGNKVTISFTAVDDLISSKWVNQEIGPYANTRTSTTTSGGSTTTTTPKSKPKPNNPWDSFVRWIK